MRPGRGSPLVLRLFFRLFRLPWLCLAVSAPASLPSAGARTALQAPQPPFRTGVVLVEVDTIVTDGRGQFVPGLRPEDFEVLEEGVPQTIERMYVVDGHTATLINPPSSPTPVPTGTTPTGTTPAGASAATTSAGATSTQRVFVLLFDQEHLQEGAFKRLRDAATSFLTKEFQQGDVGGVVVGSSLAGNQLTSDREALLGAVRNAKPSAAKTSLRLELHEWPRLSGETEAVRIALMNDSEVLNQAVRRACQDDPGMCRGEDPTAQVTWKARQIVGELRPRARRTVMTLQALASGLARLPGRKTILLMTEGFFVEESYADLRQIVGAAARSNVRIYSIDARGLDTRYMNDIPALSPMDPFGGIPLEGYNTIEDGPNALAVDSGGRAIRHTNNFTEALTEIARDTSHYYVIGYSPAAHAPDGSFRRITVRVKRPGLTARARRGYLATQTPAAGGPVAAPASTPAASSSSSDRPGAASVAPAPTAASAPGGPTAAPGTAPVPERSPVTPAGAATGHPTPGLNEASPPLRLRPDSTGRVLDLAVREGGVSSDRTLASQGWERYQAGDLEGAEEILGKAVLDPNAHPWVRYALGYAELGLGHPDKAAHAWEQVRTAVPEFRSVYLDLADAYLQMKDPGHAFDVLRIADTRWPIDADILNAIGTIQVRRGALDDAIKTFTRATEAKESDWIAYFNLGRTYELRYFKMRRYSRSGAGWIANPADLKSAIASYEEYVKRGGPYEAQAREAIQKLQWVR